MKAKVTEIYVYQDSNAISVFGGATSVNVNTGFGDTGTRGSLIYTLSGDPRLTTTSLPSNLLANDIAIVPLSNNGIFDMYQKIGTTPRDWQQIVRAKSTSNRYDAVFSAGVASITIPLSNLVTNLSNTYTAENFVVQLELEDKAETPNNYPITHSIDVNVVSSNLVISIKAAVFNGTSWSSITSETRTAHINITVI